MMGQKQMEMRVSLIELLQIIIDMHWLVIPISHEDVELKMTKLKWQAVSKEPCFQPFFHSPRMQMDAGSMGRELGHLEHLWDRFIWKAILIFRQAVLRELESAGFPLCLMLALTLPGCLDWRFWDHSACAVHSPCFLTRPWTSQELKLAAIHVTFVYQGCLIKFYRNGKEYFSQLGWMVLHFQVLPRTIGSSPDNANQRLTSDLGSASRPYDKTDCPVLLNSSSLETNL